MCLLCAFCPFSIQSCKILCFDSCEQLHVWRTPFAGYLSVQGIAAGVEKKSLNTSVVSLNGVFVLLMLQHGEIRLL